MSESNLGRKRNYSLDLLRIISMLMIVFLHEQTKGGVKSVWIESQPLSMFMYWVTSLSVCSVNIFVMLSGYFMVGQDFKPSRVVKVIAQVLFYAWIICFVLLLIDDTYFLSEGMIKSIFPISFRKYWFATCYVGMCLFSPVLNSAINAMSRKQHKTALVLLLIATVLLSDIIPQSSAFNVESGYSIVWFMVLYILAAYIRKYDVAADIKKSKLLLVYVGSSVVILGITLALHYFLPRYPMFSSYVYETYYCRYNSVFVLIETVALFILFSKIDITNSVAVKLISFFAPLTFGVYLIHDNNDIKNVVWKYALDLFGDVSQCLVLKAIGAVLVVFIVCALIDFIRKNIFVVVEKLNFVKGFYSKLDKLLSVKNKE